MLHRMVVTFGYVMSMKSYQNKINGTEQYLTVVLFYAVNSSWFHFVGYG